MLRQSIAILLLWQTSAITLYNKIEISNKTGAACFDGSEYAFYLWEAQAEDKPVNKVLIYFEETPLGWCVKEDLSSSMDHCLKYLTQDYLIDYGSSKNWGGGFLPLVGITSPYDGGEFGMWTKVIIKSCDGGAYMGNRDSIDYKKHKFHIKGSVNVEEVFKYLQNKKIITNKDQIILAGSLNGAIAAMNYLDLLKQYTNSPIRLFIDAAFYLNEQNRKTNRPQLQNRMKMVQKVFLNDRPAPLKACADANKDEAWKCMFGLELSKHIKQPIFYTQSLYDGWAIENILGYKCAADFASLSECQEKEREIIQEYHINVTQALRQVAQKQGNGVFGIACVAHEFVNGRWNNDNFEVPMSSQNSVMNVTGRWLKTKQTTVEIDSVKWPQNKPCARKLVSKSKYLLKGY